MKHVALAPKFVVVEVGQVAVVDATCQVVAGGVVDLEDLQGGKLAEEW